MTNSPPRRTDLSRSSPVSGKPRATGLQNHVRSRKTDFSPKPTRCDHQMLGHESHDRNDVPHRKPVPEKGCRRSFHHGRGRSLKQNLEKSAPCATLPARLAHITWIRSFLNGRETEIVFEGMRATLQEVRCGLPRVPRFPVRLPYTELLLRKQSDFRYTDDRGFFSCDQHAPRM